MLQSDGRQCSYPSSPAEKQFTRGALQSARVALTPECYLKTPIPIKGSIQRFALLTLWALLPALTWAEAAPQQSVDDGKGAEAELSYWDEYFKDPETGDFDASNYLANAPLGFLPVPSIITEPATGTGFALGAVFFHESDEQKQQRVSKGALLPPNVTIAGGGYTENGSWGGGLVQLGFWRKDTIRYRGYLLYPDVNLDFYSLPSTGELPKPIELNIVGPFVANSLLFRLPDSNWFTGPRQIYGNVETRLASGLPDIVPPPVADYLDDQINNEVTTSGLGWVVEFDSTDNPFNPAEGYNVRANYTWYRDGFGSDVDYDAYQLTTLGYWKLGRQFQLGLRGDYQGVDADDNNRLPSYVPPAVNLRGVPAARYQGLRVLTFEAQLDYNITPRWKIGVFGGLAKTADSFDELDNGEAIDSIGTGVRYLIAKRYGFAMGIDIARGPEETAWYIKAGSNW